MTAFRLNLILLLNLIFFLNGCALNSTRHKIVRDMALGATAGIIVGQFKSNNKSAYSAMYAGLSATTVGVMSVSYHTKNDEQVRVENETLRANLDALQKQLSPNLVDKGSTLFRSSLPKELLGLVDLGEWKRYKLDQWVQDPNQPNTWYRQIEMFEVIPPISK